VRRSACRKALPRQAREPKRDPRGRTLGLLPWLFHGITATIVWALGGLALGGFSSANPVSRADGAGPVCSSDTMHAGFAEGGFLLFEHFAIRTQRFPH